MKTEKAYKTEYLNETVKISDGGNFIIFVPDYFIDSEKRKRFAYSVFTNCDINFAKSVFSNIHKYKEIKLDGYSKKWFFYYDASPILQSVFESDINLFKHSCTHDIYFIHYGSFGIKNIEEDRLFYF